MNKNLQEPISVSQNINIDLEKALDNIMLVLNSKERDVLISRFSLNNRPKETLDFIGKKFSITRERVRQIEGNALNKLKRTINSSSSQLKYINKEAQAILMENGGVIAENDLIAKILNKFGKTHSALEGNMIKLSLSVDVEISSNDKGKNLVDSWRFVEIKLEDIESITDAGYKLLKKKGAVGSDEWIISSIIGLNLFKEKRPTDKFILSCLSIDGRIRKNEDSQWGLMEWRSVNPKSIRDKAKIILTKEMKPLHFIEIANKISSVGFTKKNVTIQAVHNELIKYDDFVLVGRGVYGLKKWGLISGSVADVIKSVIIKSGKTLSKHEIVREVRKIRDVKIGTISLNLQKNDKFIRVGRAMYTVNEQAVEGE